MRGFQLWLLKLGAENIVKAENRIFNQESQKEPTKATARHFENEKLRKKIREKTRKIARGKIHIFHLCTKKC